MRALWSTWVALWDLREHPRSMALVRVCLGLVVLWDLLQIAWLGLVPALLGLEPAGLSPTLRAPSPAPITALLPDGDAGAWLFYAALCTCAALFTSGVLTRVGLVGFVLLSAQWEWMLPGASRGIESAIRIALLLLAFSQSDQTLSLTAWWRTGSVFGDGKPVPAWPRHLLICQLVLIYFFAGIQKFGLAWSPANGFSALYLILQDPAIANARYDWLGHQPWYALTQIGTAATMLWEWSTPLLLLVYWFRFTADRPGRLRAWSNRWRPHLWWAAVGLVFHGAIALTMALGIFPAAMLSLYFALVHPSELTRES